MKKIKLEKNQELIKAGMIFFIASIATSLLNYLYHMAMGRMLGPEKYGILGALFAIIYIASFSTGTFSTVISKYSSEFNKKNQKGYLKKLIVGSFIKLAKIGFFLLILYILISPLIARFLNLDGIYGIGGVIIVGLIAYMSILHSILNGALNGLQKFLWQNVSGVISTLFKFSFAVLLVYLSFGVTGAITAVLIGSIAGIFVSAYPLKKELKNIKIEHFDTKRVYRYTFLVFLSALLPVLLITVDQLLVKHFFSSASAGYYIVLGDIGKIIWFGSGFLGGAFFPKFVALKTKNDKKGLSSLFKKSILYTSILAFTGVIIYSIAPELIVKILFGNSYASISPLLALFGLSMAFFSINHIIVMYNLAVEKFNFIYILATGIIIEVILIMLFHQTLMQITLAVLFANIFNIIALLIYNRKEIIK